MNFLKGPLTATMLFIGFHDRGLMSSKDDMLTEKKSFNFHKNLSFEVAGMWTYF